MFSKLLVFTAIVSINAFMPLNRKLASTKIYSGESTDTNANTFAAPVPTPLLTASDDSDEVLVDFDALAEESAAAAFKTKADISDMIVTSERKAPRQAGWFPLLLSPVTLDGSLAGDVGFDPVGFSPDKATLLRMREAEIKHSRLAMLCAAGWPLSELWHKEIASTLGLDSILASGDRAPSVLNGGLDSFWIIGAAAFSLALGGLLELKTSEAQQKASYKPGELGFDPLGLYAFRASFGLDKIMENISRDEKLSRARFDMDLSEIKHGRLAMIAVAGYVASEFVSGIPVVQQTPFFFGDPIL